jgi:hypothetical protein
MIDFLMQTGAAVKVYIFRGWHIGVIVNQFPPALVPICYRTVAAAYNDGHLERIPSFINFSAMFRYVTGIKVAVNV